MNVLCNRHLHSCTPAGSAGGAGANAHAPVPLLVAARPTAFSISRRDVFDRYSLMASLAMELDRLLGETLSREVRFMDDDIDCTCGTRKPRRRERRDGCTQRSPACTVLCGCTASLYPQQRLQTAVEGGNQPYDQRRVIVT